MAPKTPPGASALIIDPDPGIGRLIATVLDHSGFRTVATDDLDSAAALLETSDFAVILRDLNLTRSNGDRGLEQLMATPPELLQRTIVITTAPARAATAIRPGAVFAIVGKPFLPEQLVNTVQACARGSREADRPKAARTPSSRQSRVTEPEAEVPLKLDGLLRFVQSVPSLQHLMSVPVSSQREAALRAEMHRTLGALAATLTEAAHVETSRTRSAIFRGASTVAERLATVPTPAMARPARHREH